MKFIELQKYNKYSVILRQDDNGNPLATEPFVVACMPNTQNGEVIDWSYGHYFNDLFNAVDFARSRGKGTIQFFRVEEIAGKAIDGLIEDDVETAYEYFATEIEMDNREAEYFGLNTELLEQYK